MPADPLDIGERPDLLTPERAAVRAAVEKRLEPLMRLWFATDDDDEPRPDAVVEHDAENVVIDISWDLDAAGLLVRPVDGQAEEG